MDIHYSVIVFKEGKSYVAYAPQLDLSSCGKTVDEARKMLREAVDLFLEEAKKMKTLDTILEEAGYIKTNKEWSAPQIIEVAQE